MSNILYIMYIISSSKKQEKILTFIKKYTAKNNYPPSIREICQGVNLKSPATVHVHIKNLLAKFVFVVC